MPPRRSSRPRSRSSISPTPETPDHVRGGQVPPISLPAQTGITRDSADRLYVAANGAGEVWRVDRDRTICVLARGFPTVSSPSFGGGNPGFPRRNLYAAHFYRLDRGAAERGRLAFPAANIAPRSAASPRCCSLSGFTIPLQCLDLAVRDIERQHAHDLAVRCEEHRTRLAVHIDTTRRSRRSASPAFHQACSVRATRSRPKTGRARADPCRRRRRAARRPRRATPRASPAHPPVQPRGTDRRAHRAARVRCRSETRRSSTWRRARTASWRTLSSLLPTISAIWSYG